MTQPEALYLADILEDAGKPADIAEKAAAELRRLYAELERCKQVRVLHRARYWSGDGRRHPRKDGERMTSLRDAAQAALKELEALKERGVWGDWDGVTDALKAALAEPEGGEQV